MGLEEEGGAEVMEWRVMLRVEGVDPTNFFGFLMSETISYPSTPSIPSTHSTLRKDTNIMLSRRKKEDDKGNS